MAASSYPDLDRPPLVVRDLEHDVVQPGGLWRRVDLRAQTDSTNADAGTAARAGEPEGLVVVADLQRAGRGRRDRHWVSPPRAGLTFSLLLRPGVADPARGWDAVPNRAYSWLPLLAGVSLLTAVTRLTGLDAALKWPNDLLIRRHGTEHKCAGILAEAVAGSPPAVVLGIGLNVTTRADELPDTGGLPATSLQLAGAAVTDRDALLRATLRAFADGYGRWRAVGGDAQRCGLLDEYRQGCATIGRRVRVQVPDGVVAGEAATVDAAGRLVVAAPDGERRVAAGDVVHVR
ncbi:MAG TPA: biotin--[acetyl-CoA-carboxylase] ligase [Actinoplanes sp.]|nr:biotin--[acetyl-CoA-carboxylase] ligase [Actinoplanes sp.]